MNAYQRHKAKNTRNQQRIARLVKRIKYQIGHLKDPLPKRMKILVSEAEAAVLMANPVFLRLNPEVHSGRQRSPRPAAGPAGPAAQPLR